MAIGSSSSSATLSSNTNTEIPVDSNMHPLYFSNNDVPTLSLVSKRLVGSDNYGSWRRSMEITLSAKNKLCLVDGSFPEPVADSQLHKMWRRANDMVISWIFNSVSEEIGNSLNFVTTAKSVWMQLHHRFSTVDGHRIFQIEKDLHKLEQGNCSVEIYFHKMKGLWHET